MGVTARDNRLFVEAVLYRFAPAFLGAICRSVSATSSRCIGASAGGTVRRLAVDQERACRGAKIVLSFKLRELIGPMRDHLFDFA